MKQPHDPLELLALAREIEAETKAREDALRANLRALPQPGPDEGAEAILLMAPNEMGGGSILFVSSATADALARAFPTTTANSTEPFGGLRLITTSALPLPAVPTTDEEARDDDDPATTP